MDLSQALVKTVELSTCHIRKDDDQLLKLLVLEHQQTVTTDIFVPVVLGARYGYVIVIGDLTVNSMVERGASAELRAILEWCLDPAQGVMYLAFEGDAMVLDELPVFDW